MKKKLIIVLLLIIISIPLIIFLTKPTKLTISPEYHNKGYLKEITKEELLTKLNSNGTFILFTYNNFCTFKISCDEIFNESAKNLNITILKIPFIDFKETTLYTNVKYAPSVMIINKGEIISYLDPEKDKDLPKYQDSNEFTKWLQEYLNI